MASLRNIFAKLSKTERKRLDQLDRMERWLGDLAGKFTQELENLQQPNGDFKIMAYEIDVDGSNYTKKELAAVAKKIEALHDICMKKDVALDVTGFSLLPTQYTVTAHGSASSGRNVSVSYNASKTYCHYVHPRCSELQSNGLKLRFSHARGTAAPEAEIQKIVTEGLSGEMTVSRPLRLNR